MPAVIVRQVRDPEGGEYALPQQEYLLAHGLSAAQIAVAMALLAQGESVQSVAATTETEWTRDSSAALVCLDPRQADTISVLLRGTRTFSISNPHAVIREKPMPRRESPRIARETRPARRRLGRCERPHSTAGKDWHVGKPNCGVD